MFFMDISKEGPDRSVQQISLQKLKYSHSLGLQKIKKSKGDIFKIIVVQCLSEFGWSHHDSITGTQA